MNHILTAALVLSLLSGATALADPDNNDYGDHHNDWGRHDRGHDRGHDDENRYDHDRGDHDRGDHDRGDRHDESDRGHNRHWSRGDRLPDEYRQDRYYVNDWQQHGLRRPPRGYRWMRNDDNDFYLMIIESGVIGDTIYREDRDQRWRERYNRTYTYDDDVYYKECRNAPDPAGIVVGAVIGGLLGNAAGHGHDRGGSTLAGVIVGGAVGGALTSHLNCDDRSYAYKSYYDGFNAGRSDSDYEWQNPGNNHRGKFHVNRYYNDRAGFRCATFRQTIYGEGRPYSVDGQACRQPDGVWAIVN
jgi:Ni/Co efflux regulator RcnB/surface antigen